MLKKYIFICVVFLFALFFSSISLAQYSISASSYKYPNYSADVATIATASINPVGNKSKWRKLRIRTQKRFVNGVRTYFKVRIYSPNIQKCQKNIAKKLPGLGVI